MFLNLFLSIELCVLHGVVVYTIYLLPAAAAATAARLVCGAAPLLGVSLPSTLIPYFRTLIKGTSLPFLKKHT